MQRSTLIYLLTLTLASVVLADSKTDEARLGSDYTSIPLWRSGAGTNIVSAGFGSPPQSVNLTLSTNVEFIMIASDQCDQCTENGDVYTSGDSSSVDITAEDIAYTAVYPQGSLDTLLLSATFAEDLITDAREDAGNPRPITLVSSVKRDASTPAGGTDTQFSTGSSGFWGLGIYQPKTSYSILPNMLTVNTNGSPSGAAYYTIGFDIANYSADANAQAGTIHWGAVPRDAFQGDFNWISVNPSVAAGWGIPVNRMRVGKTVIDTSPYYGSLDPGFDGIYVPTKVAESFFAAVPDASRDLQDTTRWNLPCDLNISMTVAIAGYEYNVAPSELVQGRDVARRTCWSSVIAWSNSSLPEQLGEIRLGTPFMSGVYSAFYYSENQQYVGIVGKTGSVNDLNVNHDGVGHLNTKLAGILVGALLAVFILLFVLCYSHNRNSFQSIWYRAIREQHRYQTNAMVRAATLPPPMMMPPPTAPLMGLPPMNRYARPMMGMVRPMAPPMYGPPAYMPPMQPLPPPQQYLTYPQQGEGGIGPQRLQPQPFPAAIEPQRRGFYSPRQQFQGVNPTDFPRPTDGIPSELPPTAPNTSAVLDVPVGTTMNQPMSSKSSKPLRWGPVTSTRQPKDASLALQDGEEVRAGQQGWDDGGKKYDEWLREYSGIRQDQQRYPEHRATRIQTRFLTPVYQTPAPALSEKKVIGIGQRRVEGVIQRWVSPIWDAQLLRGHSPSVRKSWFGVNR